MDSYTQFDGGSNQAPSPRRRGEKRAPIVMVGCVVLQSLDGDTADFLREN
jgi:hypothetical protein